MGNKRRIIAEHGGVNQDMPMNIFKSGKRLEMGAVALGLILKFNCNKFVNQLL